MNTRFKKPFLAALILCFWAAAALAHEVHLPVIVDTDGGADDIRAIAMLVNSGGADIRLIVTSDGVLAPQQAGASVMKLLACMGQPHIPVASGSALPMDPPPFRKLNAGLKWPDCPRAKAGAPARSEGAAVSAVTQALSGQGDGFLYLCLGPMTNLAGALKADPGIRERLTRVVYLGGAPNSAAPGWNTRRDPEAARAVYAAGLPIYGLGLAQGQYPAFDRKVYSRLADMDSGTARLLAGLHNFPAMQEKIDQGHTRIWDEMAVVYLNRIWAFDFEPEKAGADAFRLKSFDRAAVLDAYFRLLGNPSDFHLDARQSVVLNTFPMAPEQMRPDVAPHTAEIISTHGMEEWKACLMTSELHRHLGIYSLIGAKMGIRARELLEAPFDTLSVRSSAGLKPPLSCLNDGLQVSTGASLGRGTIRVLEEAPAPAAEFIRDDVRLTLVLKPQYIQHIRADIQAAVKQFGGIGPDYFAHIRQLSIKYWQAFDRRILFEERFSKRTN